MIKRWEELSRDEIGALDKDKSIVMLPLSATEQHGAHLPVGTDFDVASVAAVDTGDGNLTNKIQIERGGFDPDREGNYTVTYTVADSHGLATEKTVTYSVCQKEKLALYSDDLSGQRMYL